MWWAGCGRTALSHTTQHSEAMRPDDCRSLAGLEHLPTNLCRTLGRVQMRLSALPDALLTDGVSRLQTNKYNSTCWPYCHGHALPPSWLKACNPARNGGAHDHHGFDHGVVLRGR